MKSIVTSLLILVLPYLLPAQRLSQSTHHCELGVKLNADFSKGYAIDSILKVYAPSSLPGLSIAIYSEAEGWWVGAAGYANIEKKIPMEPCHLQYVQSVAKTYMATAILRLKEQGKIQLDVPITNYLPLRYSRYLKDPKRYTIRMLLNHTSGIPEYNSNPNFVSKVLMHPSAYFSQEDCLKSIAGEIDQYPPGTKYQYTNTNYLLLSLIGDALTGDHTAYIRKNIFQQLGLTNSYYGLGHNYLEGLFLPESYWDALNVSRPANFSRLQKVTVVSSKGDDGIVCTPVDAVRFLKGLMEGKLLNDTSMKEMLDFVKDEKGRNRYGMGMIYFDLGGVIAYGHGGGGIGAGCALLYIPSRKTYVFLATNLGVLVDGDLSNKADKMKNAIVATLLK